MMRVEWTEPAHADLDDLVRYISKDSAYCARHFVERILHATRRLREFPESGRGILEAEDSTLRESVVQGYCMMYRLEIVRALVLAIMHGSRNLGDQTTKRWGNGVVGNHQIGFYSDPKYPFITRLREPHNGRMDANIYRSNKIILERLRVALQCH